MKHMKLFALAAVLAAGSVACGSDNSADNGNGDGGTEGTNHAVTVADNAFEPTEVTAAVGDSVTWTWTGTAEMHNVVEDNQAFSSGSPVATDGTTFEHTFTEAGEFTYTCQVHPTEMTGTITVS